MTHARIPDELADLLELLCLGELTPAEAQRLEELVRDDAESLAHYVRFMHLHALAERFEGASPQREARLLEQQVGLEEEGPAVQNPPRLAASPRQRRPHRRLRWAIAAVAVGLMLVVTPFVAHRLSRSERSNIGPMAGAHGMVLAGKVAVDGTCRESIPDGSAISVQGNIKAWIRLSDGSQGDFDPDTHAVLHGATAELRQLIELTEGGGTFRVLKAQGGFRVETPAGRVTVLGTEFSVRLVDSHDSGASEMNAGKMALVVAVLSGTVQVESGGQTSVLKAGESRTFRRARAEGSQEAGDVVPVGAGGYLRTRPQPCKPLPEVVHKTESFQKPVITGQWWSSLLWQQKKFSQPLFAHPLAATCTESGLAVSYPGARIHGDPKGIFGSGGGKDGDLKLGHSVVSTFEQADCDGYSDWSVSAVFSSGKARMRVSLGHGSPFVYCLYTGGDPTVSFTRAPQVWSGGEKEPVLGITAGGNHYGLFGPAGSTWTGLGDATLTNNAHGKPYFSIALLPDDRPETLALFQKYAYNHVVDTQVDFRVEEGLVRATYRSTVKAYEGDATGTIFSLYPHQWKYTTTKLIGLAYGSVRGAMKVAVGEAFATEVPIQGVLPMLPAAGVQDRSRMLGYLKAEAEKKPRDAFADTYWEGKFLGRLATLSGIAEVTGDAELQQTFVAEIKRRLENWFTAAAGKDQPVFYYNATWNALIGSRPSYGSDSSLNDHHFHYGYFIRAAAEVARLDPAWAEKWGPMVKMLIRDIASPGRNDPKFAYLRCFDKYAGHSWASGDANFGDGNNQESSSESMNAWYGMILWGQATGNMTIRDTGLFLFNTERTAVEEYWFDVSATNYPKDYPNVALGMVWGGKGAFGTWFSGDIDCIHGINWLPFTPASIYMGRYPDYVKRNHDRIVEKRKGGRDYNNGWGDLVVMFHALDDPHDAAQYIDANPDCKLEGGNSHAFMYHWIYTLNNLGRNDASVTADYPVVNVFRKGGVKSYAVYNYQTTPLTVSFSDGTKVVARPKTLTLRRGR